MIGEVLLPKPWRHFVNLAGRMFANAQQYIDKIVVGIDPVQSAGHDQTLHDPNMLGAELSPAK